MREHNDTVLVGAGQAGLAMSAVAAAWAPACGAGGGASANGGARNGGTRCALSSRTGRCSSPATPTPAPIPTASPLQSDPSHHRGLPGQHPGAGARAHRGGEPRRGRDGTGFVVSLTDGSLRARCVVVATGPFPRAAIPQPSQDVSPSVLQTNPTRYRCPGDLPGGAVLVVGSGASGCQIADELLHDRRRVYLSVSRHRRAPRRLRGRDVYWWPDKMGRFAQPIDSFPGRQWPPSTVVTGVNGGYDVNVRQLAAADVRVVGRVVGASGVRLAIDANANQILDVAGRRSISGR